MPLCQTRLHIIQHINKHNLSHFNYNNWFGTQLNEQTQNQTHTHTRHLSSLHLLLYIKQKCHLSTIKIESPRWSSERSSEPYWSNSHSKYQAHRAYKYKKWRKSSWGLKLEDDLALYSYEIRKTTSASKDLSHVAVKRLLCMKHTVLLTNLPCRRTQLQN